MNFYEIKDKLMEQSCDYDCYFNGGVLPVYCFTKKNNINIDVRATIEQFEGEANYFLVNFDLYPQYNSVDYANTCTKKYKNIDDFISDFATINKTIQEIGRTFKNIGLF